MFEPGIILFLEKYSEAHLASAALDLALVCVLFIA